MLVMSNSVLAILLEYETSRPRLAEKPSAEKTDILMKPNENDSKPWPNPPGDRQQAIRRRAEEIYRRNGRIPGRDAENWAQAEQEILAESAESASRKAIVVKVGDAQYIGQYDPQSSDGYIPGEFDSGASVPVCFQDDKMYIKRPNGKVLETVIVNQAGVSKVGADKMSVSQTDVDKSGKNKAGKNKTG